MDMVSKKEKLSDKFGPFLESEKLVDFNKKRVTSTVHGKNGYGRLTFFKFALKAKWETVYSKDSKNNLYSITIDADNLDIYSGSDSIPTVQSTGTKVTFSGITETIDLAEVEYFFCKEFGWFLELNQEKKFCIMLNGQVLDYSKLISERDSVILICPKTNRKFELRYLQWNEKLDEYSRYYFLDSNNNEKFKKPTSFNNKGDSFYHSVFIKSNYFDSFQYEPVTDDEEDRQLSIFDIRQDEEYKFLIRELIQFLSNKRKPFLRQYSKKLLVQLHDNKAFPKFNEKNVWEKLKKEELEIVIRELYQVEPKIFSKLNNEQQKTFVHLLNLVIDAGENENLFKILNEIINLDSKEREELAGVLQTTKLSKVIKAIRLIQDRYKAIGELNRLVFNKTLKANERDHIQKFVESHYWIFGEQYNMVTAAEQKFEEALRRFVYLLRGEKNKKKIDHADKNREMDIFLVRQDLRNDMVNSIVVELKHPEIKLREKQLRQVKQYMDVILKQDEFNGSNLFWVFLTGLSVKELLMLRDRLQCVNIFPRVNFGGKMKGALSFSVKCSSI